MLVDHLETLAMLVVCRVSVGLRDQPCDPKSEGTPAFANIWSPLTAVATITGSAFVLLHGAGDRSN